MLLLILESLSWKLSDFFKNVFTTFTYSSFHLSEHIILHSIQHKKLPTFADLPDDGDSDGIVATNGKHDWTWN